MTYLALQPHAQRRVLLAQRLDRVGREVGQVRVGQRGDCPRADVLALSLLVVRAGQEGRHRGFPEERYGQHTTHRQRDRSRDRHENSGALTSLLQVAEGDPSRADLADARLDDEQLLAVLPLRTQTAT